MPGIKLNLGISKYGFTGGISTGVKGARFGVSSRGASVSAGIPGTGLSYQKYLTSGKKDSTTITPSQNLIVETSGGILCSICGFDQWKLYSKGFLLWKKKYLCCAQCGEDEVSLDEYKKFPIKNPDVLDYL